MSVYSGKCDFADHIEIHSMDQILNKNIYVGKNIVVPLKITSIKDCIPYYPYLVAVSNSNGIYLTEESFIDTDEREILSLSLKHLLRYYNRCKRKHVPYIPEEAIEKTWGAYIKMEYDKVLADRIQKYGNKATIEGVHTGIHHLYRRKLYHTMVENGYTPFISHLWVYHEINNELINKENDHVDKLP